MQRPPRARKPIKRAEAAAETSELINQICDPKVTKKWKNDALQPIAVKPEAARQLRKKDLLNYHPPLYLRKFPSKPLIYP